MIASDVHSGRAVATLDDLLTMPPVDIGGLDIALTNLLCATGLPGAEDMDIPDCRHRLDSLADMARRKIERDLPRFKSDPGQFKFPRPVSENFFRIINMVTALKVDAGLHYNPKRQNGKGSRPFNSKDMLINGLLSEHRIGTCNSIPVVVVAVGRRLGRFARRHVPNQPFDVPADCLGRPAIGQPGQTPAIPAMIVQVDPPPPAGVDHAVHRVLGPIRSHVGSPAKVAARAKRAASWRGEPLPCLWGESRQRLYKALTESRIGWPGR